MVDALDAVVQIGKLCSRRRILVRALIGNVIIPLDLLANRLILYCGVALLVTEQATVSIVGLGVISLLVLLGRVRVLLVVLSERDELEDLKRVRVVCRGSRDTKTVTLGDANFIALEAQIAVDLNPQPSVLVVTKFDLCWAAQVAVVQSTMAKRQTIDAIVLALPVVGGAIVEESPQHATVSTMAINGNGKALELAHCVYTCAPNVMGAVPHHPDIDVATAPFWTIRPKVDIYNPIGL